MSEKQKIKVLVVDDEPDIVEILKYNLQKEGYDVATAEDGIKAVKVAGKFLPDVILLDIMMPNQDGVETCLQLRQIPELKNSFIIFLTARMEEYSEVAAFDVGADDYITKPFDSDVLLHKIKAILKRNEEMHREEVNAEFDLGNYHFNPRLRELTVNGKVQTLSPKENELLKMLSEYKNDLLPREAALKKIWGSDTYFNGRSMDVYIAKLRKYLKEDPKLEIVNIHGNGFRLVQSD